MDVSQLNPEVTEEEWGEDEEGEFEEEEEDNSPSLEDQLWAEINKARANKANAGAAQSSQPLPHEQSSTSRNAITTMRLILSCVQKDAETLAAFQNTFIPEFGGKSLFSLFSETVASGTISVALAKVLHQVISALASSNLFPSPYQPNGLTSQTDKGKRKRDQFTEDVDTPKAKRSFRAPETLESQLTGAVQAIIHAFSTTDGQPLDPGLVSSLKLPLHQIFLFVVTFSARESPNRHVLQEIGGLIQVIGVVSGHQIGAHHPDLGTAAYPCQMTGCDKVFSRLYSLRAHQRAHADERPYHCVSCPAAFARNHDLKRHMTMHDKKAWKCLGCEKIFSRRDAFKRHKNTSQRSGKDTACAEADGIEVDVDDKEASREERRSKMWTGGPIQPDASGFEMGELPSSIVAAVETAVLSLHPLLQARVAQTLGHDASAQVASPDSASTLASVIARAQSLSHSRAPQQAKFSLTAPHDMAVVAAVPQVPKLVGYGLTDEQAKLLEHVVAAAASAAQAQAEAEAALEEEQEMEEEDHD